MLARGKGDSKAFAPVPNEVSRRKHSAYFVSTRAGEVEKIGEKEKQRCLHVMHCNGNQDNTDLEIGGLLIVRMEKIKMEVVEIT